MNHALILIFILLGLLLMYESLITYRAIKVSKFLNDVTDRSFITARNYLKSISTKEEFLEKHKNFTRLFDKVKALNNKYPYEHFVYSFKKLTLENYYTEEEIKIINGDILNEWD